MYRAIGFLVVAGFALFGASKFIEDHVVLEKADPDDLEGEADEGDINPSRVGTDPQLA